MKHKVILVVLDGLNYDVARHAMGHLQAYVSAGRGTLYKLKRHLDEAGLDLATPRLSVQVVTASSGNLQKE